MLEVVELEDVVVALVTVVVGADVGVVAPVVVTGGGGEDAPVDAGHTGGPGWV